MATRSPQAPAPRRHFLAKYAVRFSFLCRRMFMRHRLAIPARFALLLLVATLALAQTPPSQQQQPSQRRSDRPVKIDPVYSDIANRTGGQVFVPDPANMEGLGEMLALLSSSNALELLSVQGTGTETEKLYSAPVGEGMGRLVVSATGVKGVRVRRPDGSEVTPGAGVKYLKLGNGGIYAIDSPPAGHWEAVLEEPGDFSLKILVLRASGKSPADASARPAGSGAVPAPTPSFEPVEFDSFRFLEPGGRPGHEGLFPIQGEPIAGADTAVEAELDGDFSTARFEFRTPEGEVLSKFALTREPGGAGYSGTVTVPAQPFRIYVLGLDARGYRYQRALAQTVAPQTFRLRAPRYLELRPGEANTCVVRLKNLGLADSFHILVYDQHSYLKPLGQADFPVAGGEEAEIALTLDIPADAASADTITITAQRATDPKATNYVVLEAEISRPQP
jgi:hypothetical protein